MQEAGREDGCDRIAGALPSCSGDPLAIVRGGRCCLREGEGTMPAACAGASRSRPEIPGTAILLPRLVGMAADGASARLGDGDAGPAAIPFVRFSAGSRLAFRAGTLPLPAVVSRSLSAGAERAVPAISARCYREANVGQVLLSAGP